MPETLELNCVTWNIHRGIGADGRCDPDRIRKTLVQDISGGARLDVLALQEADAVDPPFAGFLPLDRMLAELRLAWPQADPALRWGSASQGFHGLLLLIHPEFSIRFAAVLDLPGHCHRGAVVVEAERDSIAVRFVVTHLSRLQVLRLAQMRTLGQFLARRPPMQTVLLGDCNDWRYWRGADFSRTVLGLDLVGPRRATFPVDRPFLPLDRIMTDAPGRVGAPHVLDSHAIRSASDHRPLQARVTVRRRGSIG